MVPVTDMDVHLFYFYVLFYEYQTIHHLVMFLMGLFGSFSRREGKTESDLDFLVEFDRKSFDAYMGLKEYLEDLFQCRVDLVLTSAIKPRLRSRILEETVHAPGL